MRKKKNLKKLLNLEISDYTNLTPKCGELDMPYIKCNEVPDIDYFAMYSRPSTYFYSEGTCVSFFEYDRIFDGIQGLWAAIYYGDKDLQAFYLKRFCGVKCFASPDYSKCGDNCEIENQYRQFRSRIVSIWLAMELNAIVIPLVSCANETGMKYMLDGMEDCEVVAFNAKGPMGDPVQMGIFIQSIKYTVDRLRHLRRIVVYSASPDKEKVRRIFKYAIDAGIEVQVPDNILQARNRLKGGADHGIN